MENPYINILLESEEMQFYLRNFGGSLKKNPTYEKFKNLPTTEILRLYGLVNLRKSNLSKRERDLVIYFAEKALNKNK
jgi:hypothetical protein